MKTADDMWSELLEAVGPPSSDGNSDLCYCPSWIGWEESPAPPPDGCDHPELKGTSHCSGRLGEKEENVRYVFLEPWWMKEDGAQVENSGGDDDSTMPEELGIDTRG